MAELRQDQYDPSGFLVGPSTEDDLDKAGREIDILRAIHGNTQDTVDQLGRIADNLGNLSWVATPGAPATPYLPTAFVPGAADPVPASPYAAMHAAPAEPGAPAGVAPEAGVGIQDTVTIAPVVIGADQSPSNLATSAPETFSPSAPVTTPSGAGHVAAADAALKPAEPAEPRARDDKGRFSPNLPHTDDPAIADPAVAQKEQADRFRQANGRFGSTGAEEPADGRESSAERRTAQALDAVSQSLDNAAQGIAGATDNIDPSVQAAKEVAGIVSPVMGAVKPLTRLFGMRKSTPEDKRQRTNVMWFRRIWTAQKEQQGGSSRMGLILAGLVSMLGMLLAPIKALARLTGMMRALGGLGALLKGASVLSRGRGTRAAGRRAPGAEAHRSRGAPAEARPRTTRAGIPETPGGKTPGPKDAAGKPGTHTATSAPPAKSSPSTKESKAESSTLSRMGKGLAKRLPFIGALLGLGAIGSAAMARDLPGATPEEQQQAKAERYGTYGSVAGGFLGAALGMFGGPAGAIAGGMLGDQLGESVGTWLATVDMDGMVSSVSDAFLGLANTSVKEVGAAFGYVQSKWGELVSTGSVALTGLADWAKDKWKAATDSIAQARDYVADRASSARRSVSDAATSVKDAGQNALNTVTGGAYSGGSNARKQALIKAMDDGGITDQKSKAALMANVDHESQGFTRGEENLNYSAKRLQQVFKKYYPDAASARADAGDPEAIANKVYGGRMGNTEPGDGYKYRGRGDIQLTGKAQYEAMGKKLGIDLVNNPDLANDDRYRSQIAVQHWKDSGANAAAARGDIAGARVKTNGGTNGMADVNAKYDKYLAQAQAGDLTPTRRADEVRVAAPAAAGDAIARTVATVKGATALPGLPGGTSAPASASAVPLGMIPLDKMNVPPATVASAAPGLSAIPAALKAASVPPVALPTLKMPSYSAPAADASQVKVPSMPSVPRPLLGGGANRPSPAAQPPMILTQDLEDRRIAHAATGGLGGATMGRM